MNRPTHTRHAHKKYRIYPVFFVTLHTIHKRNRRVRRESVVLFVFQIPELPEDQSQFQFLFPSEQYTKFFGRKAAHCGVRLFACLFHAVKIRITPFQFSDSQYGHPITSILPCTGHGLFETSVAGCFCRSGSRSSEYCSACRNRSSSGSTS